MKIRLLRRCWGGVGVVLWALTLAGVLGCQGPTEYRHEVDEGAYAIIAGQEETVLGEATGFTIEKPSDTLRRLLLAEQDLPVVGEASWGRDKLKPVAHWPDDDYPVLAGEGVIDPNRVVMHDTLVLNLEDVLQVGAENNVTYQEYKEAVFRAALDLELEQNEFQSTFIGQVKNNLSADTRDDDTVGGNVGGGELGWEQRFKNGMSVSSAIAVDLANLLTGKQASSMGIVADTSISIPLLRGSGEHIVGEPLTQAERNVIYAIWDFELYKKELAVSIADRYLSVLQQLDTIRNNEADYRSRIASARRNRRLAEAGRIQEIEVDQAVQNELNGRQRWIASQRNYHNQLDEFKRFLGLPGDARIVLEPNDLVTLREPTQEMIAAIRAEDEADIEVVTPPADAAIELEMPDKREAGPYELDEDEAVGLAFANRLDLRTALEKVIDTQRKVVVAADSLGAELTLLGSARFGESRSLASADERDARLRGDEGVFSALVTLDLPFERTAESLAYRESYIRLEQAVRSVQQLEDAIKVSLRSSLRKMLESRENMYIQSKAVYTAEKRVKSVTMFLEAGRAETRDLLDAQDALLESQNTLTGAVVDYRIAELEIQRDMGVLAVDEDGLWQEYAQGN